LRDRSPSRRHSALLLLRRPPRPTLFPYTTLFRSEYVGHPGYYRIAFDDDGDDGFKDPASIIPAGRSCAAGEPNCGQDDYYNNDTVLIDDFGRHDDSPSGKRYAVDVTLPDVECENCTLQIIQVMTEQSKAPYDPAADNADDLYYQCIDLRLRAEGRSEERRVGK